MTDADKLKMALAQLQEFARYERAPDVDPLSSDDEQLSAEFLEGYHYGRKLAKNQALFVLDVIEGGALKERINPPAKRGCCGRCK